MKQYILIMLSLLFIVSIHSYQQEITPISYDMLNVQLSVSLEQDTEDVISQTFALLAEDAELHINDMVLAVYDQDGELVERRTDLDYSRVRSTNQFNFREMYGFTFALELIREENGYKTVIEELNYDVIGQGYRAMPEEVSEAFLPLYEALAVNFRTSYLVNLPFKQPAIMVISHAGATELPTNDYARWKRARGFDVTVVNLEDIGTNPTNAMIKNYIVNFYNNAENKPDYLQLVGNARPGSTLHLPTFYAGNDNDATDLPYGLITGNDYFPEILVGRFSVNNSYELATVVNKTIKYEREPYLDDSDWMDRALFAAGNYASTLPIPVTPVLFSKWLMNLFYDYGYTEVDTIFWYPGSPPMTGQVIDAVNRSAQYINYRGWGAAMGWHYPLFHTDHLVTTNSGSKSPIVTSFVCNTADFANSNHNPCFGEKWMIMGTPVNPNGAVGFIGPSYLHTSTEFNNAIASGFHWGIQHEGIRCLGTALLRGKIEIYNGYPNDQEPGGLVDFYFRIYNSLSDTALNTWVRIPDDMNIALPSQIDQGTNFIEFNAPNLSGGYVTITRDEEEYKTHRIEDNYAFIPINPEDQGDIKMTVTAKNHIPTIQTIEITSSENITLMEYDFGGAEINPGETIALSTMLKNYGSSTVSNVTATLSNNQEDFVNITNDTADYGDIESGGTAAGSFEFEILPECPHHTVIQFTLDISPTDDVAKLQVLVVGLLFEIDDYAVNSPNSVLDPGETATIDVSITNIGNLDAYGLVAYVEPQSDAVFGVTSDPISFGDVMIGESGSASFEVTAHEDAFVGRQVYFVLHFEDEVGRITSTYFNITLGEVTNVHPTGPCSYGYYAYDSFDTEYLHAPEYDWIDIDPENGGPGNDLWLGDDETVTMYMPFTFRYYGIDYDEISICSNGWITFIPTEEINFRNWPLPSPIAPKGVIAPFWDDLKGLDDVGNELRLAWYHDEANNRMIISWLDAYSNANLTPSGKEKIQIILKPRPDQDGDIIFQYNTVWNQNHTRNYSTVGIMDHSRTVGLQYTYANTYPPSATPLQDGMAIRITTDAPDPYTYAEETTIPSAALNLKQNYPNPFNPETMIEFALPGQSHTTLEVFNIRGQRVKTLVNRVLEAGVHNFVWNGTDDHNMAVGSGVYLYRLSTSEATQVRRMILMK